MSSKEFPGPKGFRLFQTKCTLPTEDQILLSDIFNFSYYKQYKLVIRGLHRMAERIDSYNNSLISAQNTINGCLLEVLQYMDQDIS